MKDENRDEGGGGRNVTWWEKEQGSETGGMDQEVRRAVMRVPETLTFRGSLAHKSSMWQPLLWVAALGFCGPPAGRRRVSV